MRLAVHYHPRIKQVTVEVGESTRAKFALLRKLEVAIQEVPRERADDLFELLAERWSLVVEIERLLEPLMPEDCGSIKEFARP